MSALLRQSVRRKEPEREEAPLRSYGPDEVRLPIQTCRMVFCLDVSGSTHDRILNAEIASLREIHNHLSVEAKTACRVIPWDTEAHEIIGTDDLHRLDARGSTDPTCMLRSQQHLDLLRKADIWCLYTDGDIDREDIHFYARLFGRSGLQMKPCVLVLFGYSYRPPYLQNISVGVSVFAISPDCIFLFHDVVQGKDYVLASKGSFVEILPRGYRDKEIDMQTKWTDLLQFQYEWLANLSILPSPTIENADFILPNRTQINFERVLQSRGSPEEHAAIFRDMKSLDSFLLTASSRGEQNAVKNWLQQQARLLSEQNPLEIVCTDVNDAARLSLTKVLSLLARGRMHSNDMENATRELRQAHYANWSAMTTAAAARSHTEQEHQELINTALARMTLFDEQILHSPKILTPSQLTQSMYRQSPLGNQFPNLPANDAVDQAHAMRNGGNPAVEDLRRRISFIPGFCRDLATNLAPTMCPCCRDSCTDFALLLIQPSEASETADFAGTDTYSQIRYPLAMGGFPETDVISRFICCEACAYTFSLLGYSPLDETVISTVPLTALPVGDNTNAWLDAFSNALGHRFARVDLPAVVIAIIEELLMENHDHPWQPNVPAHLVTQGLVQELYDIGTVFARNGQRLPIPMAATDYLIEGLFVNIPLSTKKCLAGPVVDLFRHPFESFVQLSQFLRDSGQRRSVMFMRLLWQIMEDTLDGDEWGEEDSDDPDAVRKERTEILEYLKGLEPKPEINGMSRIDMPKVRDYRYTFNWDDLTAHRVISPRTLALLQHHREYARFINEQCMPALHSCLWKFGKTKAAGAIASSVEQIFGFWLEFGDFQALCERPDDNSKVTHWVYSTSVTGERPALHKAQFVGLDHLPQPLDRQE